VKSPSQVEARPNPVEVFQRFPELPVFGVPGQVKQMAGAYISDEPLDMVRIEKIRIMCNHPVYIENLAWLDSPMHLESTLPQRVEGVTPNKPVRAGHQDPFHTHYSFDLPTSN
jgi:hypothetical protein